MSPNNSIVLENDKCDHILLTMAAILSDQKLRDEFRDFVSMFCVPPAANIESAKASTNCFKFISTEAFNETSVLLKPQSGTEEPIAATSIDNLNDFELIQIPPPTHQNETNMELHDDEDAKCIVKETNLPPLQLESIQIINDNNLCEQTNFQNLESMELIDCQIELMDEFKLTNQVELCNDELGLCNSGHNDSQSDYFGVGSICDMPEFNYLESDAVDFFNLYDQDVLIEDSNTTIANISTSGNNNCNSNNLNNIKLKKAANSNKSQSNSTHTSEMGETQFFGHNKMESELFSNWLDSVIETINDTMQYSGSGRSKALSFSIPHVG